MGNQNIKNRVAYLDGEMEILSAENKPGTSINIELNVTVNGYLLRSLIQAIY